MKTNFVFRLTVAAILLGFAIWATLGSPHSTTMGHARLVTALWQTIVKPRKRQPATESLSILALQLLFLRAS